MEEQTLSSRILPDPPRAGLSCAEARETARNILAGLHASPAVADIVLTVVSEMVSNASRHAGGVTAFKITARSGTLTVEVSDRSPAPPRIQPWAPDVPGGFGWRLVNQLATTHVQFHRGGKTVTATLITPTSSA
ncbi:ATP-binding protein [Streptomyces sp. A0592]|uniref:ATP-binding protein n=1 Tax=Streptomyces sp. A0592 TaxID=2563099 RepID=UPI00109EE1A0|nr:ATP-binding protein [Streptomyces sp. A0592]THA75420.1 ATP-binding protein [Streptomyces sp. A0592]